MFEKYFQLSSKMEFKYNSYGYRFSGSSVGGFTTSHSVVLASAKLLVCKFYTLFNFYSFAPELLLFEKIELESNRSKSIRVCSKSKFEWNFFFFCGFVCRISMKRNSKVTGCWILCTKATTLSHALLEQIEHNALQRVWFCFVCSFGLREYIWIQIQQGYDKNQKSAQ